MTFLVHSAYSQTNKTDGVFYQCLFVVISSVCDSANMFLTHIIYIVSTALLIFLNIFHLFATNFPIVGLNFSYLIKSVTGQIT